MIGQRRTFVTCVAAVLAAASIAAAKPAAELYEELFGEKDRKVTASPSKADDVAFARELFGSAGTLTEEPELRVLLYVKAHEFGSRAPEGFVVAMNALSQLAQHKPAQKADWEEKRAELYAQEYRTAIPTAKQGIGEKLLTQLLLVGDLRAEQKQWAEAQKNYQQAANLAASLRSASKDKADEKLELSRRWQRVMELVERLEKEPQNASLRMSVIRTIVTDLDDPASAVPYLNATVDEVWRTEVPLAGKEPASLPKEVCLELGNWYKLLATAEHGPGRDALVERARGYFALYLSKVKATNPSGVDLLRAQQQVAAGLADLGPTKGPTPGPAAGLDDPAVQKALDKAVAWVWSKQQADGRWAGYEGSISSSYYTAYYDVGATSQALLALLKAGQPLTDGRYSKAFRWMARSNTPYTNGVGWRCALWAAAERRSPGAFEVRMGRDIKALLVATKDGGYGMRVDTYYYGYSAGNSYSWYAPMALGEAAAARASILRKFWTVCYSYWANQQGTDGGWAAYNRATSSAYPSSVQWTAAGLASLAECVKNLHGSTGLRTLTGTGIEPLKKGVAWMDKNFARARSDSYSTTMEMYYQISRAGLLLGKRSFGGTDWFKEGCDYLLKNQRADGSWNDLNDTCFALMFLANGMRTRESGAANEEAGVAALPAPAVGIADETVRQRHLKRIEELEERAKAMPGSKTIPQEIVRIHVVELQQPDLAQPWVAKTGDPKLPGRLAKIDTEASEANEAQSLDLADWFRDMGESANASPAGKLYAYTRAQGYYERYLQLHTTGDTERLKAELALKRIQKELARLKEG